MLQAHEQVEQRQPGCDFEEGRHKPMIRISPLLPYEVHERNHVIRISNCPPSRIMGAGTAFLPLFEACAIGKVCSNWGLGRDSAWTAAEVRRRPAPFT